MSQFNGGHQRHERPDAVVLYCRVSSTGQEDNSSLRTQEERCRAYAAEQGWEVAEVFREVHTGSELFERPQLCLARKMLRNREATVLLAYALDRLSRDPVHPGVVLSEADHLGARVAFVTEPLDDSPEGQLIRFVRGYAAKVEHLKIKERTSRGRRARVESGKLLPGGKPIYGYRWRDKGKGALDIDDVTGPVIQRVYQEIAGGKTLRQVCVALTREGIQTPTGRGTYWQASSLATLLHKPAYIGRAYGWGWRKAGVHPQTFDPARAIALPDGTIPALIDEATWNAVQAILTRNKERSIRSARDPEAALLRGGYITCGHCGTTIRVRPSSRSGHEYVCAQNGRCPGTCHGHSIRTHLLDAKVWEIATAILTDPETVTIELERVRHEDPTAQDLEVIDRALGEVERKQGNLARALALIDGDDALAPLVAELQALGDRRRQLQDERERLLRRQVEWAEAKANTDGLTGWCRQVATSIETLSFKEKRMALDALGFRVVLYRSDHEPRYVITADIDPHLLSTTS